MIGIRLAILEQDHQKSTNSLRWHDSRGVSEELPGRTQQHLVVWSQRSRSGDDEGAGRREPRTIGRRAHQRHTRTSRTRETRRNAPGGTQRCGQDRNHVAGGGTPPAISPFSRRCRSPYQLDQVQNQMLEPGLCFRCQQCRRQGHWAQHHQTILTLAHVSQILARASCRGGCEGVGESEHNRIVHFILAQFVELFLCIHDLVSIVAVENDACALYWCDVHARCLSETEYEKSSSLKNEGMGFEKLGIAGEAISKRHRHRIIHARDTMCESVVEFVHPQVHALVISTDIKNPC